VSDPGITFVPEVQATTANTEQNDGDVATPNWVAYDGTWTEDKDYRTSVTFDDPTIMTRACARIEDLGGGPIQYDYVVYPAFEVINPFMVAVCYYTNIAGANLLRSNLQTFLTAPGQVTQLRYNAIGPTTLQQYAMVFWVGAPWTQYQWYNSLYNDTIAGYCVNYVSGGGNLVLMSRGFAGASSGNAYTYRYYLIGSTSSSYPSASGWGGPTFMALSFRPSSSTRYTQVGEGPGGTIDRYGYPSLNTTYWPGTAYLVSGTTQIAGVSYTFGNPWDSSSWYEYSRYISGTKRTYGSGKHMWLAVSWNETRSPAGLTIPSGPGRIGLLKNIIDDFDPEFLP